MKFGFLLYLQARASEEEAKILSTELKLDEDTSNVITGFPTKRLGPLVYRFL